MLLSDKATVIWNSRNKRHYTNLGYTYTKMGDPFDVSVCDLTKGSQAFVLLRCDYCGKEYKIQWYTYKYIHRKSSIQNDACADCCEMKAKDAVIEKYGSHQEMYFSSNEKRVATNISRYGTENVFGSSEIKKRIVNTNLSRYGVAYTQQSENVRNKTIRTCMEKYGVENYVELFKGTFIGENSPVWKGGAEASRVERATHEYIIWRASVFNRDRYTCCICGARNGNGEEVELHAHHINNWADYPEDRYRVDNGITLCSKCHYGFHSKYGKRLVTREQLDEYIALNR